VTTPATAQHTLDVQRGQPGVSEDDAVAALGVSQATANRYWTYARAWLMNAMDEEKADYFGAY